MSYVAYNAEMTASAYCHADPREVGVKVQYTRNEWPFGEVVMRFEGAEIVMRPNQVRRLVRILEKAIVKAEDRCR
jgi:hypothetical protein